MESQHTRQSRWKKKNPYSLCMQHFASCALPSENSKTWLQVISDVPEPGVALGQCSSVYCWIFAAACSGLLPCIGCHWRGWMACQALCPPCFAERTQCLGNITWPPWIFLSARWMESWWEIQTAECWEQRRRKKCYTKPVNGKNWNEGLVQCLVCLGCVLRQGQVPL